MRNHTEQLWLLLGVAGAPAFTGCFCTASVFSFTRTDCLDLQNFLVFLEIAFMFKSISVWQRPVTWSWFVFLRKWDLKGLLIPIFKLRCCLCNTCFVISVYSAWNYKFAGNNEVGAFINVRNLELDLDLKGIQVHSGMELGIVIGMLCCSGMMRVGTDSSVSWIHHRGTREHLNHI